MKKAWTGAKPKDGPLSFILPDGYTLDTAPVPASSRVDILEVEPQRVAAIRFNGRFKNYNGEANRARLATWLAARSLGHLGDWRLAGYDPPFTLPMLRRNEVLVTLE